MFGRKLSSIPIPVSLIVNLMVDWLSKYATFSTINVTFPGGLVNFIAFDRMFIIICFSFVSSPKYHSSGSQLFINSNSSPLSRHCDCVIILICSITEPKRNSSLRRVILPDSMRLISRISLIRLSRCPALSPIFMR